MPTVPAFQQPNMNLQASTAYKTRIENSLANASPGSWHNLGIALSGGTLTLQGEDGTALSSTNPAWVTFPSKVTLGSRTTVDLEANRTLADVTVGAAMTGNLFGTTTSIAWASALPLYLYAVLSTDELSWEPALSRVPHLFVSPAVGTLGTPSSAVASTQGSMLFMSSVTVANYTATPVICLGSLRATKNSSNAWTFTALTNGQDGIGRYQVGSTFTMPVAQNGAATSKYWLDNGGTAPAFTTNSYLYTIEPIGMVNVYVQNETNSTTGVGAVTAKLALPMTNASTSGPVFGSGYWFDNSATFFFNTTPAVGSGVATATFIQNGATGNITNGAINASDHVDLTVRFLANTA